jgi:hypothetical protein
MNIVVEVHELDAMTLDETTSRGERNGSDRIATFPIPTFRATDRGIARTRST